MVGLKVLLCMVLMSAVLVQQGNAGWFRIRIRWRKVVTVVAQCYFAGCFNKQQIGELCEGVEKAMIKREEWQAMEPRHIQRVNGIANNVIVWHTGPDTCKILGLSGSNCQRCIQDEACIKEHLAAFQAADLNEGMDDIRYNFLIGQDGVIYEGRGWGVVGQHTKGENSMSVGIGMIGDFSKSEPSQASQNALKNLINCGQAAEAVSRDPEFTTGPEMTGKAFFEMVKRCNGLCADQSASRG